MTAWTSDELGRIASADELRIAFERPDGSEAGGVSRDVTFAAPGDGIDEELDAAYRAKYRRYSANIVNSVLSPQARSATVKLVPR